MTRVPIQTSRAIDWHRWGRPVAVGLTITVLGLWALEVWYGFAVLSWGQAFGDDLEIYTSATARLLSGGEWFLPRQMSPYLIEQGDVLYPPVTAWFFSPFVVLGPAVFLAAGVAVIGWSVWSWRPAPWSWPLLALFLIAPATTLKAWSGNPSLWVGVFVALGLRYQWPSALVLCKPTFLPFALIGIRTREWWAAVAAMGILSLPFLAETLRYPAVLLNAQGSTPLYSVWDWPLALIPVVAYLAARTDPSRRDGTDSVQLDRTATSPT
jgi:hypothetical protein